MSISPAELKHLEESLLQPELRQSPQHLATLLADDFIEFGRAGQIFDKLQTIAALSQDSTAQFTLLDFQARPLAIDVWLVTYRTLRHNPITGQATHSLRSSIWKLQDSRWQIVFHQGTPTNFS